MSGIVGRIPGTVNPVCAFLGPRPADAAAEAILIAVTALAGLTVLDLTQNVAGPYCTQILGDLGADVVKIERPGRGDETRAWAPPRWGADGTLFLAFNRNKRSLALDVKAPGARPVIERLVRRSDVLVQSFRPGNAEQLGFGAAQARALNRRLVYCSVTAFGRRGPLHEQPGYDPMMQGYTGLMRLTGHPGQAPVRAGTSLVDMGTGMWAALGVVAALRERDQTGEGSEVSTALFDTALGWIPYQVMGYLATGEVPQPQGSAAAMIVPYQAFSTADGWLMITTPTDALFGRLCEALGRPDLATDSRYRTNPDRVQHRATLVPALEELTRPWPTPALLERLRQAGVSAAPVQTVDQVATDPQTKASEMLVPTPRPDIPDLTTMALPLRFGDDRPLPRRPPPRVGEHTIDVLGELGFGAVEMGELRAQGVVDWPLPG
jgi:crotonobetainyl-CoA:carnitine CoA-transferase CaiB-like acyl-CoA transferase